MYWVVRHKNPEVPATNVGKNWVSDGVGLKWSKDQAEQWAEKCEYKTSGIVYEIVPDVVEEVAPTVPEPPHKKQDDKKHS